MIIKKSPCKINLFLDIKSKREDGYHFIESLFHTIDLFDIIKIEESKEFKISTSGKYKLNDNEEDNIVAKIFYHFKNQMELKKNYKINIEKNIPTGAGLGGGSSNAATMIKFFLEELNIKPDNELIESFSKFGADIPFFIKGGLSWVSGIGEKIYSFNFTLPYKIILIYPNINVSTKLAYSKFTENDFNKSDIFYIKNLLEKNGRINFNDLYSHTYNIFEKNVFNIEPKIKEYKEKAENEIKRKICMSGSGSSLFALYNQNDKNENIIIEEDYNKLKNIFEDLDIYKLNLI